MDLLDLQVEVRTAKRRSDVQKSRDVRPQYGLREPVANERVRRENRRSPSSPELFRGLFVAGSRDDDEVWIEDFRGERDIYIFCVAADGSDKALCCLDVRLVQHFVLGRVADKRNHAFIRRPVRALCVIVDENDARSSSQQFINDAPADSARSTDNMMSGDVFEHAIPPLASEIICQL